jgi:hypothetical protein
MEFARFRGTSERDFCATAIDSAAMQRAEAGIHDSRIGSGNVSGA